MIFFAQGSVGSFDVFVCGGFGKVKELVEVFSAGGKDGEKAE